MCRLFAYISVNPILLDDVLRRPIHAITQQVQAQFQGEWFLNADGFGITWHTEARSKFNPLMDDTQPAQQQSDPQPAQQQSGPGIHSRPIKIYDGPLLPFVVGPHPAIYKTTIAKPLNDPNFLSLCANVSSKCIFAHLRAAGEPPVASTNNHPFVFGRHCFMHNGYISDFGEIRNAMVREISDGFTSMIEGGTDTEHLAALYMTYLCEPKDFHGADKHYTASEMWQAMSAAIQNVEGIQTGRGKTPDNFLNICATDGESLFTLCYRSTVSHATPPFDLWVSGDVASTLDRKPYASTHGIIFEDKRSAKEIDEAARGLLRDAKPVVIRGPDNELKGIERELQDILQLEEDEEPLPSRHGPHLVVASEPTTIDPGWFKLCNRDVILVDKVWKPEGQVYTLRISPETL